MTHCASEQGGSMQVPRLAHAALKSFWPSPIDAPYQDLASVASDLYGPSAGKGLGAVIGKAIGNPGDHSLMAAAVLEPTTGVPLYLAKKAANSLMGKLASSQNPTLLRLLTGAGGKPVDHALANAIARALGAGAATGSQPLARS